MNILSVIVAIWLIYFVIAPSTTYSKMWWLHPHYYLLNNIIIWYNYPLLSYTLAHPLSFDSHYRYRTLNRRISRISHASSQLKPTSRPPISYQSSQILRSWTLPTFRTFSTQSGSADHLPSLSWGIEGSRYWDSMWIGRSDLPSKRHIQLDL